jgi:hypothetical protein
MATSEQFDETGLDSSAADRAVFDRVHALEGFLGERAAEIEAARTLTPEVTRALYDAGVFTALTPGSRIKIQFDKVLVLSKLDKPHLSSYNDGYNTYNSIIKWCKKMDDDQSISNFAIGAKVV